MPFKFPDSELGDSLQGVPWPSSLRQMALDLALRTDETTYWVIAFAALTIYVVAGSRLIHSYESGSRKHSVYPALACLIMLLLAALRWPTFAESALNTDEEFFIAGAMALRRYPGFFGMLDGTTSGPLNLYPLLILPALGFRLDSGNVRLASLVILAATLLFTVFCTAKLCRLRTAFFLILPVTVLFGATAHAGWVHYASEYVSLVFIAAALHVLIPIIIEKRVSPSQSVALALAAALMPFAKLQSALFAALFMGWFSLLLFFRTDKPNTFAGKLKSFLMAIVVCMLPYLVLGVLSLYSTAIGDFRISYFESSIYYSSLMTRTALERVMIFFRMIGSDSEIFWAFLVITVLWGGAVLAMPARRRSIPASFLMLLLLSVTVIVTGLATVMTTGRDFTHYLLFLVVPAASMTIVLLALLINQSGQGHRPSTVPALSLLCTIVILIPKAISGHPTFARVASIPRVQETIAARAIASLKGQQDELAVWGWCSDIHAQADIAPGNRDIITEREIIPLPVRSYYRSRYVEDIRSRQPAFFVDSTGTNQCAMNYNDRMVFGHEVDPVLDEVISSRYQFMLDLDQLRVYVSLKRLADIVGPEYLHPLIVYLDLTIHDEKSYNEFASALHQLIEQEERKRTGSARYSRNKIVALYQSLTQSALAVLVSNGRFDHTKAEDLQRRAITQSRSILSTDETDTGSKFRLKDPVEWFRRVSRKWSRTEALNR